MRWPPRIGEVLPRADQAWFDRIKVEDWILGAKGHGLELRRVFRVGPDDWKRVGTVIVEAAIGAKILVVRDRPPFGITCGIEVDLTIDGRTATLVISWHYAEKRAAPRLVTAYPTSSMRRRSGSNS